MTKSKKVLNYWSKRATKRKLICTNDKLLEKYEFKFLNSEIKKKLESIRYWMWRWLFIKIFTNVKKYKRSRHRFQQ